MLGEGYVRFKVWDEVTFRDSGWLMFQTEIKFRVSVRVMVEFRTSLRIRFYLEGRSRVQFTFWVNYRFRLSISLSVKNTVE